MSSTEVEIRRELLTGINLTCPKCKNELPNKEQYWHLRELVTIVYPTHKEHHEELECNRCFDTLDMRRNPKKAMKRILKEEKHERTSL